MSLVSTLHYMTGELMKLLILKLLIHQAISGYLLICMHVTQVGVQITVTCHVIRYLLIANHTSMASFMMG